MFRKFAYIFIPLLLITLIFLGFVLLINRQGGKGALQVTSKPKAQVFLDENMIGETPLALTELPELLDVGEYRLRIVPIDKNLRPYEDKITIYKGALTVVDRTFEKALQASTGSVITLTDIDDKSKSEIMIISFPKDAQVILDGNDMGVTPKLIEDVTISDHEIKIIKDGYREKVVKVKAVPGKRIEVTATLGLRTDLTEQEEATVSATLKKQVEILDTPTGFLRVRDSASLNSSQIGTVSPGEKFDFVSETEAWYQILLTDDTTGWISSEYAQITEEQDLEQEEQEQEAEEPTE